MLIWFLLGLMVGLLLFLSPLLLGDKLPFPLRTRIANIYYDISMRLFGRLVFWSYTKIRPQENKAQGGIRRVR